MNEQIDALERAAAHFGGTMFPVRACRKDAATLRQLAADLRSGALVRRDVVEAEVVEWLRVQSGERPSMFQSRNLARAIAAKEFADAIANGAHRQGGE